MTPAARIRELITCPLQHSRRDQWKPKRQLGRGRLLTVEETAELSRSDSDGRARLVEKIVAEMRDPRGPKR
jgi:hypothetical protein